MPRSDGRHIKNLSPFVKIMPYIMERRSDALIHHHQTVIVDHIDAYIHAKRESGIKMNYMHVFIAVFVRVLAQRPQINRFVMNGRYYARNHIAISMAIKRSLHDDGEETTIKFMFTGKESIFEVAQTVDAVIHENIGENTQNETDQLAAKFMSLPGPFVKAAVRTVKWLDRHNHMPAGIIKASPFHTSLFFTYLKSIKLDYIYHHLYDFGTTGVFVALGKVKKMPVAENGSVVEKAVCDIGYVLDERLCDGLYFANTLKLAKKYLEDLTLLETSLDAIVEDVD
ncbi:2-oxo acid dehydrogenase subunit E2 [Acidaminobacter hydrogenoformans]|uniref:2-oxoacid dehydrogenases acyltransferase (Catalytic domain) n=1 Tax=Acidaminobacter hydrogenoformans DSM 2784 TaxID=1120920 RepID=A0A1G5RWB7_9FIRM|nr:2-oxo acid dehydrogenase subunit E2 [Acidaminobacter hydrogenoformans]SCZ77741.1 2-oxoacid dehydrogenases acyltransferase (catalytic domain) [Acidaminobacter hydrogenoformans DSM 2784]